LLQEPQKHTDASPKFVQFRPFGQFSKNASHSPQSATHSGSCGAPQTVPPVHSSPPSVQGAPSFGSPSITSSSHTSAPPAPPSAAGGKHRPYSNVCPGSHGSFTSQPSAHRPPALPTMKRPDRKVLTRLILCQLLESKHDASNYAACRVDTWVTGQIYRPVEQARMAGLHLQLGGRVEVHVETRSEIDKPVR